MTNPRDTLRQEKLDSILDPEKARQHFKITIRFEPFASPLFAEAMQVARANPNFYQEGEGQDSKFFVSYEPPQARELLRMFEYVRTVPTTRLYLNNKTIPYVHELWIFLMWFYLVK